MKKEPERDLFGEVIIEPAHSHGYAANPGTGPAGETCRTCKYYARLVYSKTYRKCAKVHRRWTRGSATDILAGAPACHHWEKREEQV